MRKVCFLVFIFSLFAFQIFGIDAVLNLDGKAFFFQGEQYVKFDIAKDKVDAGYPLPIKGNWHGFPWSRIDAAVELGDGKAFFFYQDEYVKYDMKKEKVDPGYPMSITA